MGHARHPAQPVPLTQHPAHAPAVAAAAAAAGLAILIIPDAPRPLVALIVAMLTGSPVTAGITRHWKISLHPGVAAGTATVLVIVFGSARLTTGLIVAAIGSDGPASTSAAHPLQVTIDPLVGALVATIVFRPLK